jgi:hypothetical protein
MMMNFTACILHQIVTKSRRLRWAQHVVHIGDGRVVYKVSGWEN